jgi:hypothetical protein
MLLNKGVDSGTKATIIPRTQFDVITGAHSIPSSNTSVEPGFSTVVYGLGWEIFSYEGHNVSET